MKYAIISDIHGNLPALQLVLADAAAQGAQQYLFVGDYCVSAPWPAEVTSLLMHMENAHFVCGNEESYLNIGDGDDGQFAVTRWCKNTLNAQQQNWLLALPAQLTLDCDGTPLHMAHSSEAFVGKTIHAHLRTRAVSQRWPARTISREEFSQYAQSSLLHDDAFCQAAASLPEGIYIFGHTHTQFHIQLDNRLFINPGSCGLPLDCCDFGAPYTLLTIENGHTLVEERRLPYDVEALIVLAKASAQYAAAPEWSEVIFREWRTVREKIVDFLHFCDSYAHAVGDERRPFARDTWHAAFEAWMNTQ